MLKLSIFAIVLFLSSTFGLIETLFRAGNDCYSGCRSKYVNSLSNLNACRKGLFINSFTRKNIKYCI